MTPPTTRCTGPGRFFHGYYDCYCYLPFYVFCGRHLLLAKLWPSGIDAAASSVEEVERIVGQIRVRDEWPPGARHLYEAIYCARGEMENRIKECQLDLYTDRTSAPTMRANQLRSWLAAMAYKLICAVRRIGLAETTFANATCGTIHLKLLKIGALVRISVRRISFAMASACPAADDWARAARRLVAAARARSSPA